MGIDMSRAFNTNKRKRILDVLVQAGGNNDELRLVKALLAGMKLSVLFTCYLAAALSSIRESPNRSNPPVSSLGLPLELEYTDDVDFLDEKNKLPDHLQ